MGADSHLQAFTVTGQRDPQADFDLGELVPNSDYIAGLTYSASPPGTFYISTERDELVAHPADGEPFLVPIPVGADSQLRGVATAADKLFVVDGGSRAIRAYGEPASDAKMVQAYPALGFEFPRQNGASTGVTYVGGKFFVTDAVERRVFVYGADGTFDPDSGFSLDLRDVSHTVGSRTDTYRWSTIGGIAHADDRLFIFATRSTAVATGPTAVALTRTTCGRTLGKGCETLHATSRCRRGSRAETVALSLRTAVSTLLATDTRERGEGPNRVRQRHLLRCTLAIRQGTCVRGNRRTSSISRSGARCV